MRAPEAESPINALPPVVAALFRVIVGAEAAFSLGARGLIGGPEAVGWRISYLQRFAFSGDCGECATVRSGTRQKVAAAGGDSRASIL